MAKGVDGGMLGVGGGEEGVSLCSDHVGPGGRRRRVLGWRSKLICSRCRCLQWRRGCG